MAQRDLLKRVVDVLDAAGVAYMATGSLVSSAQGQPRSTHDIDLVVQISPIDAKALVSAFPLPDYYLDEHAIREAIATGGMFNLIEETTGDKVDFWILRKDPFDQQQFARRHKQMIAGVDCWLSKPEDTILNKLRWVQNYGAGDQHIRDAIHIYEVQGQRLDVPYIERWLDALSVRHLWERVKSEAQLP